ncbi:MAG: hypothetical protein KDM63_03355 [Verrucomicrobiae bacterium]|nr:hypothetical protein [Verrucomicrobiae bacterium]
MGRRRGQAEKVDFSGLKPGDLAFAVKYGESGLKDRFFGLDRVRHWLESYASGEESEDIFDSDEVAEMVAALGDYFAGISMELDRRIEELNGEIARLDEKLRSNRIVGSVEREQNLAELAESNQRLWAFEMIQGLLERPRVDKTDPDKLQVQVVDPRFSVLLAYRELQRKRGRRPFRSELESVRIELKDGAGQMKGRAISRAAERMKLPLGDSRVRAQLLKELNKHGGCEIANMVPENRAELLLGEFKKISIESPEADWLKTSLAEAAFDSLLMVVGDEELRPLVEANVERVSTLHGREFKVSVRSLNGLGLGDGLESARSIAKSSESYCLLQALRAFSRLWHQTYRWEFDINWICLGNSQNYSEALDRLLLSLSMTEATCRDPALWIREMVKSGSTRSLLRSVWGRVRIHEVTPQSISEIQKGADRLIQIFSSGSSDDVLSCIGLARLDDDFEKLVAYLEPFFGLLKGREYGFGLQVKS